jgi:hypothetical protein
MSLRLKRIPERPRLLGWQVLAAMALVMFPSAAAGVLKPVDISPAGASGSAPRIASDGAGNIVVVWRELDGDTASIRAAFHPAGGDFGSSQRISSTAAALESPEVAMDGLGNAAAVWNRSTAQESVVQAAVRPAGGAWGPPENLSPTGEVAVKAHVAIEQGRATAVWTALRDRQTRIQSSTRTLTGPWAPAETLSGPVGSASSPAVAMDDQGGAVASWRWSDGAFLVVQAAVRSPAGLWSQPEVLSGAGRSASPPQVAMDAKGNAVVGWVRHNGSWAAAQVTDRPAGGRWQVPHNLSDRGNAGRLDLAMNSRGDAVASWLQRGRAWSAFRPAASSRWTHAPFAEEWFGGVPRVALDAAGNATAVWAGALTISASFKPVGEPWQHNYAISGDDFDLVEQPVVTTQRPENATAVWIRAGERDDFIQTISYDINTYKQEVEEEDEDEDEETLTVRAGVVAVPIHCRVRACRGVLALTVQTRRLGSRRFVIPRGRAKVVRVKLSRLGRELVEQRRRVRATLVLRRRGDHLHSRTVMLKA